MLTENLTGTAARGAGLAVFAGECMAVVWDLRWMLAGVVVLILADFWLGVCASLRKRAEFRFSRAGRRTTAKFIEYLSYLVVGAVLGMSLTEPLGVCSHTTAAACALGLAAVWEVDSIIGHACEIRGIRLRVSVKRLLVWLLAKKFGITDDKKDNAK